jgi:hypothetical protein
MSAHRPSSATEAVSACGSPAWQRHNSRLTPPSPDGLDYRRDATLLVALVEPLSRQLLPESGSGALVLCVGAIPRRCENRAASLAPRYPKGMRERLSTLAANSLHV